MTVVVTGAAGFLGRHLVSALLGGGHTVVGIDRRPGIPAPAIALHTDLAEPDGAATDALREAEAVYHLAAFAGVRATGAAAAAQRRRDNVEATRLVLDAVPLHVPVVVTSSSSVYGGAPGRPSAETDRVQPCGGYAASKVEVERLCAERASAGGLVAVARPFTVAGEGQRPDMAISRWLAQAQAGRPLTILGSRARTRDITDVRDIVEGLLRMGRGNVRSTINLGTGRAHRLDEMASAVCRAVGVDAPITVVPVDVAEPPATLADTRRCRSLLGFVPTTDLDALVARQLAAARPLVGAAL